MLNIRKVSIVSTLSVGLLVGLGYSTFSEDANSENVQPVQSVAIEQPELNTINVEGNYAKIDSATQLLEEAELVIVGTPKEAFLNRVHKVSYSNDQTVEDYYTETVVNVEKIIKSPSDLTISKNSNFKVIEPAVGIIENSKGEKAKITTGPYTEMEKEMTYLIFLVKNMNGEYSVLYNTLGKYNIDNKDTKDSNTKNYDDEYESWKEKKVKFKNVFKNKFNL